MSDRLDGQSGLSRYRWWFLLTGLLMIALLALVVAQSGDPRPLKPLRALSPEGSALNDQPLMLTFGELELDPGGQLNQRLRLTGAYTPVEISNCAMPRGPRIRWHMVADDLVVNAVGYETVLRLIPFGTMLTVEGIWRQYSGRVGCGKNAAEGIVWYLEVERIVQPNPLYGTESGGGDSVSGSIPFPPLGPEGTPVPPEPIPGANPETAGTSTVVIATPMTTPVITLSSTPTAQPGTGTPTPFAGDVTATPTGPSRTPGPTATAGNTIPPVGTASPSPSPTPSQTPLPGAPTATLLPTQPPLVTATTGGGYPGPPSDSTPTATSEPYP